MSNRKFDVVVARKGYQTAVSDLSEAQLKFIYEEGVRIYAGIHLRGGTHVELSPGDDVRGAYSDFVVQNFETAQWEYVYIDAEGLCDFIDETPSPAVLQDLKDYLEDACSNVAENLFDKYLQCESDRQDSV